MTRTEFEALVSEKYSVLADYPFEGDFETGVFRHSDSKKWFGIAMNIDYSKIVKGAEGKVEVVNLKCAPEIIESLVGIEPGVYRAYHMNKTHWLTLALCECTADTVDWLVEISYQLTDSKQKKRKNR